MTAAQEQERSTYDGPGDHAPRFAEREPSNARTRAVVVAAYAICTAIWITRHEPWRDEAQPRLIARDIDLLGLHPALPPPLDCGFSPRRLRLRRGTLGARISPSAQSRRRSAPFPLRDDRHPWRAVDLSRRPCPGGCGCVFVGTSVARPRVGAALHIALLVSADGTWYRARSDLRTQFSGAEATAVLPSEHAPGVPVAAYAFQSATSVMATAPDRVWFRNEPARDGTYWRFDQAFAATTELSADEVLSRYRQRFPRGAALLLLNGPLVDPLRANLILAYANYKEIPDLRERFFVYAPATAVAR